ncbi:hypothetical protein [Cacatuid alphaherpesvirus 2]|uniref:Uncharacterized protein n=1 Tax=Cacatuid alphaherpesvirus 2 TaxID=2604840 RepID=A0A5B9R024_9ALPH|nr:hypothetical protein QKT46_gp42 [Cacatuid alphaherpesvirus 2]QEG54101.1 hypothetical protein [Cacatuid alphaherpesvirus 2]
MSAHSILIKNYLREHVPHFSNTNICVLINRTLANIAMDYAIFVYLTIILPCSCHSWLEPKLHKPRDLLVANVSIGHDTLFVCAWPRPENDYFLDWDLTADLQTRAYSNEKSTDGMFSALLVKGSQNLLAEKIECVLKRKTADTELDGNILTERQALYIRTAIPAMILSILGFLLSIVIVLGVISAANSRRSSVNLPYLDFSDYP